MNFITKRLGLPLAAACAFAVAVPAHVGAQTSDIKESKKSQSQQREEQSDGEQIEGKKRRDRQLDKEAQRQSKKDQNNNDQARLRFEPEGWISIATDYDRDGRFDAIETIYYYDLEFARNRSKQRMADSGQLSSEERLRPSFDQRGWEQPQQKRQVTIQGTLRDKRSADLVGHEDHECVVGRIETQSGEMTTVYLGKKQDLDGLDLQTGDKVKVEGVRSRLNDEPAVMARRVSAGGQSVTNDVPQEQPLRKYVGRISDLETTTFRGRDGEWMIARLRTEANGWQQINLGKKNKLKQLDLQEGDKLKVLARPGRINDRSALIAQVVRANDTSVDVREPTNRKLKSDRQRSRDRR